MVCEVANYSEMGTHLLHGVDPCIDYSVYHSPVRIMPSICVAGVHGFSRAIGIPLTGAGSISEQPHPGRDDLPHSCPAPHSGLIRPRQYI
jgi:hypothetical protein